MINEDATIQFKAVHQTPAGFGFDDDCLRVPITDNPGDEKPGDLDTGKRLLAFDLINEAIRGAVAAGHADAVRTRVAAILVLTGTETSESAAVLAKVTPDRIARAVKAAKAELEIYAARKGLKIQGI